MENKKLQIDVLGPMEDNPSLVECIIKVGFRRNLFYTPKANYEAMMYDGVFIRDGKEKNALGVINTTNVFIEDAEKLSH